MVGQATSGESVWRRSRIVLRPAAPAAGADWLVTVPAGHLYRIRSIAAILTTSAAVANRQANLAIGDGESTFITVPANAVQAASLAWTYGWWPLAVALQTGLALEAPLPDLQLMAGWTIGSAVGAIDVADAWTNIRLLIEDTTVRHGPLGLNEIPDILAELVEAGPGPG